MKKTLFSIMLFCFCITLNGQNMYDGALKEIEKNSTAIKAFRGLRDVSRIESRTGIAPDDPEISFGYIWGHPRTAGNNIDVSLSQSFDFPSAYVYRNRRADLIEQAAGFEYDEHRMEVLLTAKSLLIELVYYNALHDKYREQTIRAREILDMFLAGKKEDSCRLEYSKAILNLTNMEAELQRVVIEQGRIHANLARLNGDRPLEFGFSRYENTVLPGNFEEWYPLAEARHPSLLYYRTKIEENRLNIKVAQSEHLPEITVGYSGAFAARQDERHQGIIVGLTIPLWENRNTIRLARAQATASEYLAEDAAVNLYNKLKYKYKQALSLQKNVLKYRKALDNQDSDTILFESYRNGEISLLTYLLEIEYFFVSYEKYLRTEKDLSLAIAELEAFNL